MRVVVCWWEQRDSGLRFKSGLEDIGDHVTRVMKVVKNFFPSLRCRII